MEKKKQIIILGAGPAGLALALKLLRRNEPEWEIILIEQKSYVGGIAASFEKDGLFFDFGSHRLHPATSAEILNDLKELLGDDLLNRPRNGRIRLLGRFLKFPLNPVDLILHTPPAFVLSFLTDMLAKPFQKKHRPQRSFADALMDGLGKTICSAFYFPYARKLWGINPEDISVIQAQKRVSANSVFKIIKKVFSVLPGIKRENTGRFFYPQKGYGQISRVLANEVEKLGGKILLSSSAEEIIIKGNRPSVLKLRKENNDFVEFNHIDCDFLFSTIPISVLARLIKPLPSQDITDACKKLKYRSMILHYLLFETDQYTPYDAHYIPEDNIIISRISEPKNYSASKEPANLTGICLEIPCNLGDDIWNMTDASLTQKSLEDLKKIGLPANFPLKTSFTKRLPFVYPIYDQKFDEQFELIDDYINRFTGLVSLGRQGLFAHDNTHHTMEMAYRASDCLESNLNWKTTMWKNYRREFETHVVED
ncbi:FAD-dependent oxidoreductase [candidate division KSB1 bacterium]|nr:FAD-dependent oxidoreductase [candidate division KSB1 bacterium]